MHATISAIEYYLPTGCVDSEALALEFPGWRSLRRTLDKTGVETRHIVGKTECASDLAVSAATKLFNSTACRPEAIDFILFCTQTADYPLPATACLLQHRLSIPTTAGALDFNLGCSGFVYGLGLAEGLICSGQARSILLFTAETISIYIDDNDRASRAIFGDAAAVTWITAMDRRAPCFHPFHYGTDGKGGDHLIVRNGGARSRGVTQSTRSSNQSVDTSERRMFMDGQKIFDFALDTVPQIVTTLLEKASLTIDQIDLFVFHQANAYLLEELRRRLSIPRAKFQITLSHCANTVSSTIPIALKHAAVDRQLRTGTTVMLVSFGVGYSWAGTIIRWEQLLCT